MRVPVSVVIVLATVVVGTTWWLRTRHMDFMTPTGIAPELPAFAAPPDLEGAPIATVAANRPANRPDKEDARPAPDPIDFGDLESAPGLNEYSEHAAKGAPHLIRLATELESRGEFQRALLAWERVIDSCPASDEERAAAESAVMRLRPTLPRWSIDPAGEIPILLQLGTGRTASEGMSSGVLGAAEFLRRDSDDLCAVTPRLTTADVATGTEDGPIAVYLSGAGSAETNQSSVLAVNPESNAMEPIRRDLLAAVYKILREHLTGLEGIHVPGPPRHPDTPEDDFRRSLTRLHWQYAAKSLGQGSDPEPGPEAGDPGDEAPPAGDEEEN